MDLTLMYPGKLQFEQRKTIFKLITIAKLS